MKIFSVLFFCLIAPISSNAASDCTLNGPCPQGQKCCKSNFVIQEISRDIGIFCSEECHPPHAEEVSYKK